MSNPGKGDFPRPYNKKIYDNNFLSIDWKHNPRPKSPFQCPNCGWWPMERYAKICHLSNTSPIETKENHFVWTETWKCAECGNIFSLKNANF